MTVKKLYNMIETLRHHHPFDDDKATITWVYDPALYDKFEKIVITIQEGPTEIKLYHITEKQEVELCKP